MAANSLFAVWTALCVLCSFRWVGADDLVPGVDCYTDVDDISLAEDNVTDVSFPREYILCPNTDFVIGIRDTSSGMFIGGSFALTVRKNTIIKCGAEGKREDNCVIRDGTLGLLIAAGPFNNFDEFLDGISVQGVTFQGLREYGMFGESWGHVTMIDCAFVNNFNVAPVMLLYDGDPSGTTPLRRRALVGHDNMEDGPLNYLYHSYTQFPHSLRSKMRASQSSPPAQRSSFREERVATDNNDQRELQNPLTLTVDFVSCDFVGNGFGLPTFPGVVTILFNAMIASFRRCNFLQNEYINPGASVTYMILSDDNADLTIENTCFMDNDVTGLAPVTVVAQTITLANNSGTQDDEVDCQFVAIRPTITEEHTCIDYDAVECLAETETAAPSSRGPTSSPSGAPTVPTISPSGAPTAPTVSPSGAPTTVASSAPSKAPVTPTSMPTLNPVTEVYPSSPPTSGSISSRAIARVAVLASGALVTFLIP